MPLFADHQVDEMQFGNHPVRQYKRIDIGLPHRPGPECKKPNLEARIGNDLDILCRTKET